MEENNDVQEVQPEEQAIADALSNPEVQEKLRKVREKLGIAPPVDAPAEDIEEVMAEPQDEPTDAEQIDWSQFDLNPDIAHLYPISKMQMTEEGPRFVAPLELFEFDSAPYSKLGQMVSDRVNGPERWKIATVQSNGSGLGVVMYTRTQFYVLPNPEPLKNEADMPDVPSDEDLQETEKAAEKWIENEGAPVADESEEQEIVPAARAIAEAVAAAPDGGTIPESRQEPEPTGGEVEGS